MMKTLMIHSDNDKFKGDIMKKILIILSFLFMTPFIYSCDKDSSDDVTMIEISSDASDSVHINVKEQEEELPESFHSESEAIEQLSQINFDRETLRDSGTYTHTRFFALLKNNEIKYIVCAFFLGAVLIGIVLGPYYFNNCYGDNTDDEQKRLLEMGETVLSLSERP